MPDIFLRPAASLVLREPVGDPISGTLSATIAGPTLVATGTVEVRGSLGATVGGPSLAATGTVATAAPPGDPIGTTLGRVVVSWPQSGRAIDAARVSRSVLVAATRYVTVPSNREVSVPVVAPRSVDAPRGARSASTTPRRASVPAASRAVTAPAASRFIDAARVTRAAAGPPARAVNA